MLSEQPELDFTKPATPPIEVSSRLADLVAILESAPGAGWVKAKALRDAGFTDRELRDIGEHDQEALIFSYPGSPGYKLWSRCSVQELKRYVAIKTQCQAMMRKYVRFHRRFHREMPV